METINKILDTEIDEKIFKKIVLSTIILILMIVVIVFLNLGMIHKYKVPKDINTKDKSKVEYKINSITTGTKYIEIQGWAYKTGKNIGYFDNRFVIRNEESLEYKVLNTQMQFVDEFFSVDEKYDCRRAGMYAKSIAIGLKKGLYQIFIEYKNDDENMLVDTGNFFNYGM